VTWQDLVDESDRVDYSLEETKALFSETTKKQVTDFLAYTEQLFERFKGSGPGLPTIELPIGLDLLKEYQQEMETSTRTREQLVLAEKLFDMPITSYPMLSQVEVEIKKLAQVYAVYSEQADAVRQYAQVRAKIHLRQKFVSEHKFGGCCIITTL
jgi:dynein heavy chain